MDEEWYFVRARRNRCDSRCALLARRNRQHFAANPSDDQRGLYFAPWFQGYPGTRLSRYLPRAIYQTLSPIGQHICRSIVADA